MPSAASSIWPDGPRIALDPVGDDRLGRRPHVEIGVERAAHALDHHHGLLHHEEFGPRLHVEDFGHLEEQRQQPRHGDGRGVLPVDRLADRPERLREILHRMGVGHVAGGEMHLGDAACSRGG